MPLARVLLLIVASAQAIGAVAAPAVVVSIKPVHALVAGVMGRVGEPRLLIAGAASPHMYHMRPSEAKALNDADLIVWIGGGLETFLTHPIANLGSGAEVVTLRETAGMGLLPNRRSGIWSGKKEAEPHAGEHEGHDHGRGGLDTHIWLAPGNARQIVSAVADALVRVDPDHAEAYHRNAGKMHERILAQAEILREHLAPVRGHAFLVFHDAYQYFERAFRLNGIGTVVADPTRPPGAKQISEMRDALIEHDVRCIFIEPQFEQDLVRTVSEGTGVRVMEIDPLGADLASGENAWFDIMRRLGDVFAECLSEG